MKRIIPALILIIAIFFIWYFYPCFTFKGTYSYTQSSAPEATTYYIEIDDQFRVGDSSYGYKLKPIRRMLWVDIPDPFTRRGNHSVKLGWNAIYEWNPKSGNWAKREKVNK